MTHLLSHSPTESTSNDKTTKLKFKKKGVSKHLTKKEQNTKMQHMTTGGEKIRWLWEEREHHLTLQIQAANQGGTHKGRKVNKADFQNKMALNLWTERDSKEG